MPIIDTLIINRSQADVSRWKTFHDKGLNAMTEAELSEWLAGMKGSYNFTDLNRVGGAMQYLSARFNSYGYSVSVSSRTNWAMTDIPRQTDMETYLADVRTLRGVVAMLDTTPQTPESMALLDWSKANNIEKILVDVEDTLNRMQAAWFYAGDLFSGEV